MSIIYNVTILQYTDVFCELLPTLMMYYSIQYGYAQAIMQMIEDKIKIINTPTFIKISNSIFLKALYNVSIAVWIGALINSIGLQDVAN